MAPADGTCMPGGPLLLLLLLSLALPMPLGSLESSSCSRVASVLNMSLSADSGPDMSVNRSLIKEFPRLCGVMQCGAYIDYIVSIVK